MYVHMFVYVCICIDIRMYVCNGNPHRSMHTWCVCCRTITCTRRSPSPPQLTYVLCFRCRHFSMPCAILRISTNVPFIGCCIHCFFHAHMDQSFPHRATLAQVRHLYVCMLASTCLTSHSSLHTRQHAMMKKHSMHFCVLLPLFLPTDHKPVFSRPQCVA